VSWGDVRYAKKFYFENLNEKDPIQDLEIDGGVI